MADHPKSALQGLSSRIWKTSKSRKVAEERLLRSASDYELAAQLSTAHVIILNILSQFTSEAILEFSMNLISICLAVFIFALTSLLFGARYRERALEFKGCYVKLDSLRSKIEEAIKNQLASDSDDFSKEYHEILASYQNHTPEDWSIFILNEKRRITSRSSEHSDEDRAILAEPVPWRIRLLEPITAWRKTIFIALFSTIFLFVGLVIWVELCFYG